MTFRFRFTISLLLTFLHEIVYFSVTDIISCHQFSGLKYAKLLSYSSTGQKFDCGLSGAIRAIFLSGSCRGESIFLPLPVSKVYFMYGLMITSHLQSQPRQVGSSPYDITLSSSVSSTFKDLYIRSTQILQSDFSILTTDD